ncbi:hypothetical protein [Microbacterium stercoris]|uniref:Flagellar biosynthesis protein FlhA n=1 Tax=Microbacterium stercoris TaxID=2820289 RepID=A0A939TQ26_9MICO|nr:hypothetical protein [Microbacterium stercoris]MBO3663030.1 hypothetical protein [Microbacterium stercoris]
MKTESIWTIVGVVIAVAIAWFLVEVVLSVMWFFAKVAAVIFVAVIVYFALHALLNRKR